jgi:hypothetical protein
LIGSAAEKAGLPVIDLHPGNAFDQIEERTIVWRILVGMPQAFDH